MMNTKQPRRRAVWCVLLVLLLVVAVVLLMRCDGCSDTSSPAVVQDDLDAGEVQAPVYSGQLRVVSTDGSYIHDVVVQDLDGAVVATGDTGNPFPVPVGNLMVQVQGQVFPVTVQQDQKTVVSVQEEVGLGRLSMPAIAGHPYPYIVPIIVTDRDGNEVARGRSGSAIDLLPGTYRATQEDRTVEFEITSGETTRIDP